MSDRGYLYVLANSAMPGMVKVGKTTRTVLERSKELSGATGLPTSFIVVFEQLFEDCTAAEQFVHSLLSKDGHRVANNREFFSAPVNEIVRAIMLAPGPISEHGKSSITVAEDNDELLQSDIHDELDELSFNGNFHQPDYVWSSVYDDAEGHYYGYDGYLEDYSDALRLYREAAKLGCLTAYNKLGKMYERGEGTSENRNKALEFYKEGARKGNAQCYWSMAMMFHHGRNSSNATKAFSLFIENHEKELPDGQHHLTVDWSEISNNCMSLLEAQFSFGVKVPEILDVIIEKRLDEIIHKTNCFIDYLRKNGNVELLPGYLKARSHLENMK
ncbi:GIY-YIG nuclease family protein [Noviherbaspirillum sp. 1P10PC]|uniref:GIY-YIG nuclease family protein n=1 Tax=Noviherbaspirillum sp. 1P10PC TaxID=3132292 RepID=UPI0039A1EBD7